LASKSGAVSLMESPMYFLYLSSRQSQSLRAEGH
jgi:hypothetical protein